MTGYEVAVRAEAALGEGPTWDTGAQLLIWIDILGSRVHTYDPPRDAARSWPRNSMWGPPSRAPAAVWW